MTGAALTRLDHRRDIVCEGRDRERFRVASLRASVAAAFQRHAPERHVVRKNLGRLSRVAAEPVLENEIRPLACLHEI